MGCTVNDVLTALSDGAWYSIASLKQKVKCNHLEDVLVFLEEFDFIEWDMVKNWVKISEDAREFLMGERCAKLSF